MISPKSAQPVLDGRWLRPGMHINAIGSNYAHKAELDAEAVLRADIIAADSVEQAKIEAGDLIRRSARTFRDGKMCANSPESWLENCGSNKFLADYAF